ncbi:MAG: SRPBCC domain-containing protein [Bacteroidetes bacterium]|nr:SRPBCC domain-containing protein [Bacteroidota bacterium]
MKKNRTRLMAMVCIALFSRDLKAQVTNTSYVTQYGEKVLQFSLVVPVQKEAAWKLFTTDDGLKKWIAPVAKIDMKTGGSIWTNYDAKKTFSDSTSIRLGIINYLENEMLSLKVNLNNNFPAGVQQEDNNLQEVIQLVETGKGKTKIISSMVGWGKGADWDIAYAFFEKGNDWTFKEIEKLYVK